MTLTAAIRLYYDSLSFNFLFLPFHDSPYRDAPVSSPAPASVPAPSTGSRRHHASPDVASTAPRRERSRRGGRKRGGASPVTALTSHPTSRGAYVETRAWLLARHGPVCAYCGTRFTPQVMTLDHVAPRRGQTAYDRRDNLVLACPGCNAAKRDLAPLAFLLASRRRAVNLLSYGEHLSPMLVDLAKSLVPLESFDSSESIDIEDGESPYRD